MRSPDWAHSLPCCHENSFWPRFLENTSSRAICRHDAYSVENNAMHFYPTTATANNFHMISDLLKFVKLSNVLDMMSACVCHHALHQSLCFKDVTRVLKRKQCRIQETIICYDLSFILCCVHLSTWWSHDMETLSALLVPLWGESTGHRWIPLTKDQ